MSEVEATLAQIDIPVDSTDTVALTAGVVSAYVSNNSLPASELPSFIAAIHAGLGNIGKPVLPVEEPRKEPAVSIKKSITHDHIICLEDGKKFKTLKRHLISTYNMTPNQYREKWGLPKDYPMTAPAYSETRSSLAKAAGLGASRKGATVKRASKPRAKKAA